MAKHNVVWAKIVPKTVPNNFLCLVKDGSRRPGDGNRGEDKRGKVENGEKEKRKDEG